MNFLGKCKAMRNAKYQQIIDWNERQGDHRRLGVELTYEIETLMTEASALIDGSLLNSFPFDWSRHWRFFFAA